MVKSIDYKTSGTCSRMIHVEAEDGVITNCKIINGCPGNTLGISKIVVGMKVEDVIKTFKGLKCGAKDTSCPDQLARALSALSEQ